MNELVLALLLPALQLLTLPAPLSTDRQYEAHVLKVLDGDTVGLDIYLGLDLHKHETIRFLGIDAPEKNTDAGKVSKKFMEDLLSDKDVILVTKADKREKYGRLLGVVWLGSQNVNELMIQKNLAKAYDGGPR